MVFDIEPEDVTIEVDEDLPSFFETLTVSESKKIIAEQENLQ
jgi:hypothetical protein